MVGLAVAWHHAVERDEILPTVLAVFGVANAHRQRTFVLALVVVYEDGRYVDAVGARHTVLAVVAGDVLQADNLLGDVGIQVFHLFLSQRHQRTV